MRFLHTADLHIDSPLRGLGRFEGAPLERLRGATRRALERLVELAIAEHVDLVLVAGDLYDRDWQDFHTGLFVRAQMVRLGQRGIRVFMVQGNHDARGVITRQVPWPDNVHLFSSRASETVLLPELGVALHGHSFPDREVPEDLVPGYPPPAPGLFNIGLLHTSLTGDAGHDTYAPTNLATLRGKGYDYWALGHVHARQVLGEHPRVVFPGNLQGRHARETGPKGCELVEVHDGQLQARFMPLDVVRWHQLLVDLAPALDLQGLQRQVAQALREATANAGELLHAVRVTLRGEASLQRDEADMPGTLAASVQAAAQDVADAEVWIEQVALELRTPVDRAQVAGGSDALAELVRWVDELAGDPGALRQFCEDTLGELWSRIPREVHEALSQDAGASDVPRLDDPQVLLGLLRDAEATLLARLHGDETGA